MKEMTDKLRQAKHQFSTAQQQAEEASKMKLAIRQKNAKLNSALTESRNTHQVAETRARQAELANEDLQRRLDVLTQTHNTALQRVAGLERMKEEVQREVQQLRSRCPDQDLVDHVNRSLQAVMAMDPGHDPAMTVDQRLDLVCKRYTEQAKTIDQLSAYIEHEKQQHSEAEEASKFSFAQTQSATLRISEFEKQLLEKETLANEVACIPGLKQQRDTLIKEKDTLVKEVQHLRARKPDRELVNALATQLQSMLAGHSELKPGMTLNQMMDLVCKICPTHQQEIHALVDALQEEKSRTKMERETAEVQLQSAQERISELETRISTRISAAAYGSQPGRSNEATEGAFPGFGVASVPSGNVRPAAPGTLAEMSEIVPTVGAGNTFPMGHHTPLSGTGAASAGPSVAQPVRMTTHREGAGFFPTGSTQSNTSAINAANTAPFWKSKTPAYVPPPMMGLSPAMQTASTTAVGTHGSGQRPSLTRVYPANGGRYDGGFITGANAPCVNYPGTTGQFPVGSGGVMPSTGYPPAGSGGVMPSTGHLPAICICSLNQ